MLKVKKLVTKSVGLKLTDNTKVKFKKNHRNTFGLMYGLPVNGGTCPGATCGKGGCLDTVDGHKRQTCYMAKITQIYKAVGKVLMDNTNMLVGKTKEEMIVVLRNTINQFVRKSPADQLYFRLHYSGDFFSEDYAKAWASVAKEFPNVHFWSYTRSFGFIEPLLSIPNFTLLLSSDPDNFEEASALYNKLKDKHNNLSITWMGNTPPDTEKYKWVVCPETSGKLKNTPDYGACARCRLCVDRLHKNRLRNIAFQIH